MKKLAAFRLRLRHSFSGQGGFTLVSTVVAFTLSGVVFAGAFLAYNNLKTQMHVLTCDRQMDQYAQACFQDLTNVLSWSWGGVQLQGGHDHPRWRFKVEDFTKEYGTQYPYQPINGFVEVTYQRNRGLLINGRIPPWQEERGLEQYDFVGAHPRRLETRTMDRRDRMMIESMTMERAFSQYDSLGSRAAVIITMVLQYSYEADSRFGMYTREYVRERKYQTQIFMRNWDSDVNKEFREQVRNGMWG